MRHFAASSLVVLTLLFSSLLSTSVRADTFRFSTLEWPPYITQHSDSNGYVAAIIREAFAASGHRAEHQFLPWARALLEAREGKYVGLYPEYYDPERLGDFVFSDPFPGGPVGFYKRVDRDIQYRHDPRLDKAAAIDSLAAYKFGVVRGYLNDPYFDRSEQLTKQESPSDLANLRLLFHQRVDLIFIDQLVAEHLVKTSMPAASRDALEMMQPPLTYKPLYVVFSKAHPQHQKAADAFNRGLQELRHSGRLDKLLKEYGIPAKSDDSLTNSPH
ncbi:ABC-type amino acid transport/signal transduction system, domain protein [gamma proteobacterium HTCC5015]|nr:ABC-type amino acid transport/signal transduction system, domain protein [gamma proteobacterium HTCC5015]